jgi:hypothetical protein
MGLLHRKYKATASAFYAGFRWADALDILAEVYHGVSLSRELNTQDLV